MYNAIGLNTPRNSGTNGHVQGNWAFVRPGKKDNSNFRLDEHIKKLDALLNRPPNKDILDHYHKRKIEVKCLEFEDILETQGLLSEEIKAKVDSYRQKLMGQGKTDLPKDEFGRISVRDTHKIAEAQQEKDAKLRETFNISEYFVEGSSFDSDRKAKEDLAKSLALQKELDAQREQAAVAAAKEKETSKDNDDHTIKKKKKKRSRESSSSPERKKDKKKKSNYALVRTPSKEGNISASNGIGGGKDNDDHTIKKKKNKRSRESSASPECKKDKMKKSNYALVRTPSKERDVSAGGGIGGGKDNDDHTIKKKQKKRSRESSASPERKKDKKVKSKKHKKENKSKKSRKRKASASDSNANTDKDTLDENCDSETETHVKKRK